MQSHNNTRVQPTLPKDKTKVTVATSAGHQAAKCAGAL